MGNCSEGEEYDAGLCYPTCPAGFTGVGPVCYAQCPSGFTDIGLFCQKGPPYGRGAGHLSEANCLASGDRGAATNGCERYAALWYPKCDPEYYNFGCCICTPECPSGWSDTGTGCTKPRYNRGAGTIPGIFSSATRIAIIVVILLFILIVIFAAVYYITHRHHRHTYNHDTNDYVSANVLNY